MSSPAITCVIPARFGSTRLPGKPLLSICNKPLVMWVYERAVAAKVFARICVATDDARIYDAVCAAGGEAVMTARHHASGTDRVHEVMSHDPNPFVVNLQGDEPCIPPLLLRRFAKRLVLLDENSLLTCVADATIKQAASHHVVKAVLDACGNALYFSRASIPFYQEQKRGGVALLRHIGIYGFSRRALERFCSLPRGRLERIEQLEQLRALEHGMRIVCLRTKYAAEGIDTRQDYEWFRRKMETRK